MPHRQIVITGLGIVSAIGIGRRDFWAGLIAGKTGVRSLDGNSQPVSVDANGPPVLRGAPIIDFDPKQYVRPRKALKVMCREIQTAFAASQLAIRDAGLNDLLPASTEGPIQPNRVGAVFGSEMLFGPPDEMLAAFRLCIREDGTVDESRFGAAAMKGVTPLWMLKYLPNMPACHVGISVNAHGPNNSLVLGDVSGPSAMMEAGSCLLRHHADVMITGATGTRISTMRLNCRHDYSAGVIGGEGSVAMVLESARHSSMRGATPLAIVVAQASRFSPSEGLRTRCRSNAVDAVGRRGSSLAIKLAIKAVMRQADVGCEKIGLIVGHQMGDPVMDAVETSACDAIFGSDVPTITPIASVAHTGAASGMFELATGVCCLLNAEDLKGSSLPSKSSTLVSNLAGRLVLCICHTSEGSATATLLSGASALAG